MNPAQSFVHLRVHSEYSVVDSLVRVKALTKKVAELGMPAVAVTDHVNFYALIKFYTAANAAGVKPICGCDLLIADDDDPENISLLVLLVQNKTGYRHLTELISRAYQEGQSRGNVCIKKSWLIGQSEGLIALSGGIKGDVGKALLKEDKQLAKECLQYWLTLFPNRFYLELQRTERAGDEEHIYAAIDLASDLDCPVVATNDVRFLSEEEFEAHEARVCIIERRTLDDPRRVRHYSEKQYLRSIEEMTSLFEDIPEALENSVEIAKRCNLELELGTPYLPDYPIPDGLSIEQFFRLESEKGLEVRFQGIFENKTDEQLVALKKPYFERLEFELGIINQMGFPGYFLIVMEFIQWAKDNDIPVGPGRGSGAGSLVAYALNITDLDPLEYDLLFERFLNPERVSMPDFDIDFCMDGRDRVIEHVSDLYGQQAVSQIITFGTMAAKAVIRDVARVQGKSYGLADKLSKLIPFEPGMTLEKAFKEEPQLAVMVKNDDDADEIMEMAFKLEGIIRNVGKHAGGVVIAPGKLTDFSPLYCDETGGNLVTQYDKNDVESAGLVKFDFLGLKTLTIIDWSLKMIKGNQGESIDINFIPLDDPKVYQMLEQGETTAVFQLESRGMKDLIKRLKPSTFEDIIALVALFRPGPLGSGMVDDFIARKHGRATVTYPHQDLEVVLENTYGVILYQEQVMQIAQVLANYSLGSADMLRRAMGKKKASEMERQRAFFLEGAEKNKIDKKQASTIFDLMEKFADYGFNKSHSAAYALVSYQTAWLKQHHPSCFMAAALSADMQNTDKIEILVEECKRMGLMLVAPDVNVGQFSFTVNQHSQIVYGLGAIKGLGEGPIDNILEARKLTGNFNHLFDFCERVDLSQVNKRAIEALIRSGGFDSFGANRAILLASMPEAIKTAEQSSRTAASGVDDLFGELVPTDGDEDVYQSFRSVFAWSPKRLLQEELDSLGIYFSGHPIEEYLGEIKKMTKNRISSLKPDRSPQLVAGLIKQIRVLTTQKGVTMAILTLDDCGNQIEASLMGEAFELYREGLAKNNVVLAEGVANINDYSGDGSIQMRIKKLYSIEEARQHFVKNLTLNLQQEGLSADSLKNLEAILLDYVQLPQENGDQNHVCDVVVNYQMTGAQGKITLSKEWRVKLYDELLYKLKNQYGEQQIALTY